MGRLLDALRADSKPAPSATPATFATLPPESRRVASVARGEGPESGESVAESQESQRVDSAKTKPASPAYTMREVRLDRHGAHFAPLTDQPDQRARLLQAIRSEGLPDSVFAGDDATPEQLAELDDAGLRAYAHALHCTAERDAGRVPAIYTTPAYCEGCGPVWLWEGCGQGHTIACPWCANRRALKPIPRPPITCEGCAHFTPDPVNPDAGMGLCGSDHATDHRHHYPMQKHTCAHWQPVAHNGA